MTELLTRQRVSDAVDPLGWRLILGVAVTHVRVSSLIQAAAAASLAVTGAGEAGEGHLSTDLHSDRLVLRLHTAALGGVTEDDLSVARSVTDALAESSRCAPNPVSATGTPRRCPRPSRSPSTRSTSR